MRRPVLVAAAVAVTTVLGVTGCSGSSSPATAPPPDPGAGALTSAQASMTSLRSYGFRLTVTRTLAGGSSRLDATGRVQTPDRIAAEVNVAGRTQRVVGLPEGQFVQPAQGGWQRAKDASLKPIPWPEVLGRLAQPTVTGSTATGSTVTGSIRPEDAATFGFPRDAALQSSRAVVGVDAQHRVTRLDLTLSGVQGTAPVQVDELVELDGFDAQAPVAAPAGVV